MHLKSPDYTVQVAFRDDFFEVPILDQATFENVVIKSMEISTEKLANDSKHGLRVLTDPSRNILRGMTSLSIDYDPATKTADFEGLRKELYEGYDWLIEKDFSKDMLEGYNGAYNLMVDPEKVKYARMQFMKIFDEIINDL